MSEVYSLLQNADIEFIEFAKDDSTLFFRIGERLLTSLNSTGQFPNYGPFCRGNQQVRRVRGGDLTRRSSAWRSSPMSFASIRMKLDKNE